MDIGSAIKLLRKKKGLTQKELAEKCEISYNALCQIELNNSFPQKSTIKRICEELGVPSSYLLFMSITDEDIPEEKKPLFKTLEKAMKNLLLDEI